MSTSRLAAALLTPRTIALVGASGDAKKDTSRPQRFLHKHGFAGRVIPINPVITSYSIHYTKLYDDAHGHIGELELHCLELDNRLAKLLALLHVIEHIL